jgi:hypothetical protein
MSHELRAVIYAAAIVIWLVAFFSPPATGRYNLVALGLAVAWVPWFWDALEAA